MTHWIIDLIILLLFALWFWKGWKKGFFRSLVYVVGSIILYIAAFLVSKKVTPFLYEKYIGPYFVEKIELYISNVGDGVRIESVIINALSKIPEFCKEMLLDGQTIEEYILHITELADGKVENISHLLVYDCMPTVLMPLIQGILFLLLILVLYFLLRWLLLLLGNHVSQKTLIGRVDSIIGGVCGLGIAFILAVVLAYIVQLLIGFTANSLSWCNKTMIDNTILFELIYDYVSSGMAVISHG